MNETLKIAVVAIAVTVVLVASGISWVREFLKEMEK